MTSYAVRGAIVEAVALGLVLSFLNRQLHYFLIGGIYALVMLVWLLLRRRRVRHVRTALYQVVPVDLRRQAG